MLLALLDVALDASFLAAAAVFLVGDLAAALLLAVELAPFLLEAVGPADADFVVEAVVLRARVGFAAALAFDGVFLTVADVFTVSLAFTCFAASFAANKATCSTSKSTLAFNASS